MKRSHAKWVPVTALCVVALATAAQAADISGAGATFPYPIYSKWADAYKQQTGIGLNYQSIGSGGGIKQIKAKTVTFGASDMPLKPEELQQAGPGAVPDDHRRRGAGGEHQGRRGRAAGARWRDGGRDLSGRDHQVGRRAHQEAQSEAAAAGDRDRAGVPLGRLGHQLPVLRLPLQVEPEVPEHRSAPTPRCSGRWASAPRATRAWPT